LEDGMLVAHGKLIRVNYFSSGKGEINTDDNVMIKIKNR